MKTLSTLAFLITCAAPVAYSQSLVNGTNYSDLYGPNGANVTVNPTDALVLTLGGSANGNLGTYWHATTTGGVSAAAGLLESGAQVRLLGDSLEFNIANTGPISSLLGLGLSTLTTTWDATATFDKTGNQLILQPNTTYRVSFLVDGSDGLLNSTLGILPNFNVQLLDGGNNAIGTASSGTLVNVAGLLGTGVPSGIATVDFTTGNTVNSSPASLRFQGSALLNATALNLGTNFATVSGISIVQVPEPSILGLVGFSALALLRRKR